MKSKTPILIAFCLVTPAIAGCFGGSTPGDAIFLETAIERAAGLVQGIAAGQNILSISGAYTVPSTGLPSSPAAQYWQIAALNATGTGVMVATFTPTSQLSYNYTFSPSMLLAAPPLPASVTLSPAASLLKAQNLMAANNPSVSQAGTIISYYLSGLGGVPTWTAGATLPNGTYVSATMNALTNALTSPMWTHQPMFPALSLAEQAMEGLNLTAPVQLLAAVGLERPAGSYEKLSTRWGVARAEIPPDAIPRDGKSPVWAFDFWIPNASLVQRVTVYGPAQVVVGEQKVLTQVESAEAATAVIPGGTLDSLDVAAMLTSSNRHPVLMTLQEHLFEDGVALWRFVVPGPSHRQEIQNIGIISVDATSGERIKAP